MNSHYLTPLKLFDCSDLFDKPNKIKQNDRNSTKPSKQKFAHTKSKLPIPKMTLKAYKTTTTKVKISYLENFL